MKSEYSFLLNPRVIQEQEIVRIKKKTILYEKLQAFR